MSDETESPVADGFEPCTGWIRNQVWLPFRRPGSVSVAIWPSLAAFCTTRNRVAVADSTPNGGEAPV